MQPDIYFVYVFFMCMCMCEFVFWMCVCVCVCKEIYGWIYWPESVVPKVWSSAPLLRPLVSIVIIKYFAQRETLLVGVMMLGGWMVMLLGSGWWCKF